jgi:hypothetical protein
MKATSTGIKDAKLERPYLCVGEGAVWIAGSDEGYTCIDSLDSDHQIGAYEDRVDEAILFEGKVTLSND